MQQPWWKVWLSYLMELHVESAASSYNPHLYVSLKNGRYQLSTAHAVYSYEDLYSNFRRAFKATDLDKLPGGEVLVMGLGLGSIPLMLEQTFHKDYRYTAVEVDEAVLHLAQKYVLDDLESSLEVIQADAYVFVEQCSTTFDLICMDIFLDDTVPTKFEEPAFLENLRDLLNPDGLLLYNRLAASKKDKRRSRLFYERQFLPVFPEATFLDVGGNYILFSRKTMLE